jgi:hypothetical protein
MIGKLNKKDSIALIYITLLSIIAVVYSFSIIPSPLTEQNITTDLKRVDDLANIKTAVDNYYQTNGTLPQSLGELTQQAFSYTQPLEKTDPQTKQPYEYTILNQYSYQLCATFTTDSKKDQPDSYVTTSVSYPVYNGDFTHPQGHYCFTQREQPPYPPPSIQINPTKYPCRAGRMCPMVLPTVPSPATYNGNVSPTPAAIRGDGNSTAY